MKKIFPFLILLTILTSCKKDTEAIDLKNKISGKWEIEQYSCGECTIRSISYLPGNGNIIIISADGTFERKINDILLFKGKYTIQKNKTCNTSSGDFTLMTNELSGSTNLSNLFITVTNDKLSLSSPYCYQDGAITTYRRIN